MSVPMQESMPPTRVIDVLDALMEQTRQRGGYPGLGSIEQAKLTVVELLEQRDALATALAELSAALPKNYKALSKIAQQRRQNGDLLAWSILNHHDVAPDACEKALAKAKNSRSLGNKGAKS